jgi:hypothetical protein
MFFNKIKCITNHFYTRFTFKNYITDCKTTFILLYTLLYSERKFSSPAVSSQLVFLQHLPDALLQFDHNPMATDVHLALDLSQRK